MSGKEYWIWASEALGAGAFMDHIFGAYPDAGELFAASPAERRMSGAFTPRQLERLASSDLAQARQNLSLCEKNGWSCVCYDEPAYPAALKTISDPPLVLYVWGSLEGINDSFCFGIVGTRNPTPESVSIARNISFGLSDAGAVIVSGGALGIDSAAHEGALDAGGKTVLVMGCGLGTRYLSANDSLRGRISRSGAVISEFAPFSSATRISFPIRNRIISGLSRGILVVEAGEKSGSIITANCAFDQGRDVFAVPGSVTTSAYAGANRLIRDGARIASGAEDIIDDYADLCPGKLKAAERSKPAGAAKPAARKKPPVGLSEEEAAVYALLGEEPVYPGEIAVKAGISVARVMTVLTVLELKEFAVSVSGGRYAAAFL